MVEGWGRGRVPPLWVVERTAWGRERVTTLIVWRRKTPPLALALALLALPVRGVRE